ncbi:MULTISPECIES: TIGR03943 family protein [Paenibacillus]|uniref:TIGR03943 family protein n=1 Tax=Paenibacillus campinasensis TaxID=66347 RepID=A0ABW9SZG2_9BACL|nr:MULTISPECIES: TIGR03943 family protein [Paenibacillus]MUG66384.1 TIGR03943 family protein [Paenibacillus campinasensis]PAK54420.1 TIGR03943 family protein [Paenibacillus sp. 7541]
MTLTASIRCHYLLRALLLASLSFYLIHLNETDLLHYYLAPHMQKLLLLCPVPLLFISFGLVWHCITGTSEQICDCEHPLPESFFKNISVYGLVAVPLLFGLLVPSQALGSDMITKKGMVYSVPAPEIRRKSDAMDAAGDSQITDSAAQKNLSLDELFIARDKYTVEFAELAKRLYTQSVIEVDSSIFSETIGAIDMYRQAFQGKHITLQGFVYREGDMKDNAFALSRFLMMCCPADAVPFGVLIQDDNALTFTNDTWVEIDGVVRSATINGEEVLQIEATQITIIEQPVSPYIFTNPDSVAEFDKLHSNS